MSDTTLDAALAQAQAAMQHPKKTKTNPHFKSTYADLADVINAVRPALNEAGIAVVQAVEGDELVTQLRGHGDVLESRIRLNLDVKPQELGSQLSYMRRYALAAIAGVASEDDDDGNAASSAKPAQRRTQARTEPVNADGEPLATRDQRDQFTALCDAAELERADRADLVKQTVGKTAWNQVTKADADKLIAELRGERWVLTKGQDGKWFAFEKDTEPWDSGDEEDPVQPTLDEVAS